MSQQHPFVELAVHDIVWSQERGHPVLVLKVADLEEFISIVLTPTDAQALSAKPACDCVERLRLAGLVEGMLARLGATLTHVTFRLDAFSVLRGEIGVTQGGKAFDLPANVADAVLLGGRAKAPFRIPTADLTLVRRIRDGRDTKRPSPPVPAPFREFIESLPADGTQEHNPNSGEAVG